LPAVAAPAVIALADGVEPPVRGGGAVAVARRRGTADLAAVRGPVPVRHHADGPGVLAGGTRSAGGQSAGSRCHHAAGALAQPDLGLPGLAGYRDAAAGNVPWRRAHPRGAGLALLAATCRGRSRRR